MNELLNKHSAEISKIVGNYPEGEKTSAVMPLLHMAQRQDGYITKRSIEEIGEILGMSSTEVVSIIGFYTLYHDQPGSRYRFQVCTDLPCALRGADEFLQKLCENLGIRVGETTPDGLFGLEEVTCLAGCHHAPIFQLQGDGKITYHEDQTIETAMELVEKLRKHGAKHLKMAQEEDE
ncbi:MAG: NAD(P)H-dependent oxidoreductase subunit E [Anaerolineaceae bacterium]